MPGRMVLAIASGKGGTGKTLVATNVAALAAAQGYRVLLADCDVEAPNDHLFFDRTVESASLVEVPVAEVDASACTSCGRCRDACAYGAVRLLGGSAIVFEELCHGCGLCTDVCDEGAMHESLRRVGEVACGPVRDRSGLSLITGTLDVGQVKSPALIRAVRAAGSTFDADLVVLDSPPGVACSAVAAVRGADALLLVTEPTEFGLHDLELSVRLGHDLALTMAVLVNRDGSGGIDVARACEGWNVPVVGRLPFARRIAEVYAQGGIVVDGMPEVARALSSLPDVMRSLAARGRGRR